MVVVAGWLLLRWLHSTLWGRQHGATATGSGLGRQSVLASGRERILARPRRRRRGQLVCVCLQNEENERRVEEESRRHNFLDETAVVDLEESRRQEKCTKRSESISSLELELCSNKDKSKCCNKVTSKSLRNETEGNPQREDELRRLEAEVASLQVVLELRGEEVRRLRRRLEGREEQERGEVEGLWSRVNTVVLSTGGSGSERATQTGYQGWQQDWEQTGKGGSEDQGLGSSGREERELTRCEEDRRVLAEEDTVSLESGYFGHSDENSNSLTPSSSPSPSSSYSSSSSSSSPLIPCSEDTEGVERAVEESLQHLLDEKPKQIMYERRPSRFLF